MNPIRAKFRVDSIKESFADEGGQKLSEEVYFNAVYSSDPNHENRSWALATPAASCYLKIDNSGAWGHFKEGQEVMITLDPIQLPG